MFSTSDKLKKIMEAAKIGHEEMAKKMEIKLQRVRNLSSGRADKLKPEEARALVNNLRVRGDFLATGEGPIFQCGAVLEQKMAGLPARLRAARGARDVEDFAQLLEVAPEEWAQIEAGTRRLTLDLLKRLFDRVPELDPMAVLLDEPQRLEGELSHLEVVLIANYRASSAEGQEMLRRLAASCAEYHSPRRLG